MRRQLGAKPESERAPPPRLPPRPTRATQPGCGNQGSLLDPAGALDPTPDERAAAAATPPGAPPPPLLAPLRLWRCAPGAVPPPAPPDPLLAAPLTQREAAEAEVEWRALLARLAAVNAGWQPWYGRLPSWLQTEPPRPAAVRISRAARDAAAAGAPLAAITPVLEEIEMVVDSLGRRAAPHAPHQVRERSRTGASLLLLAATLADLAARAAGVPRWARAFLWGSGCFREPAPAD